MGAFSLIVVINLLNRLFENCLIAFLKFKFETKLNDFDSWLQIFHHYHRFVYQQGTQYMLQLTHQDYGGQYQTPNIHEQFSHHVSDVSEFPMVSAIRRLLWTRLVPKWRTTSKWRLIQRLSTAVEPMATRGSTKPAPLRSRS